VERLKELEPVVNYLKVRDGAELWERGDLGHSARIFGQMEKVLKVFG